MSDDYRWFLILVGCVLGIWALKKFIDIFVELAERVEKAMSEEDE